MDAVVEKKKLTAVLVELEAAVSETSLFFDTLDISDLPLMLKAFGQLKAAKDRLEASTAFIKDIYDNLSYKTIPELYEVNGFDSVKAEGKNFVLNTRLDASIPYEKRQAGFKWLREVAQVPEIIQETVNPRSLSALVKRMFEATAEMPPEDAVSVHQKRYMSVRKA
jgi:hypothetical protein